MSVAHPRAVAIPLTLLSLVSVPLSAQESRTYIYEATSLYRTVIDNVLRSAEVMPAADYAFRPTSDSPTFGEWLDDVANSQMQVCSAVEQKPLPGGEAYPSSNKTDLIWALKKSKARCDSAYASVNTFNAGQQVESPNGRRSKLGLLFLNASHDQEVYGHLEDYLRLKGLVPPSGRARLLPISH